MARKNLQWFRVYGQHEAILRDIDDKKLGEAVKLAFMYFNSSSKQDEEIIKSVLEKNDFEFKTAFNVFKQGIDDSKKEYAARVEDGKRGAEARKEKQKQELIEEIMRENGGNEENPQSVFASALESLKKETNLQE